jgi:mercuric reductase
MNNDYDLAIIGSGGAAFAAAIKARGLGARVLMVERGTLGGTCLNVGCIPSKALLRAAETFHQAESHPFAGVQTAALAVDLGAMVGQKDKLVEELRQVKYADLIEAYGWDFLAGEAHFIDAETIAVGERTLRAGAYLLATGTRPSIPTIPGLADAGYLTSTTTLSLDRLPTSLAVIGSGYVGLELGQLFAHLGSEVVLLQRRKELLAAYEPEVGEALGAVLERAGVRVLSGTEISRVERVGDRRRLTITRSGQDEMLDVEELLVATGRQPNVEALNLAAAGVALDARGAPVIDDRLRTTNPRVFAAGDVTLGPQFVYVAAYEGGLAAENALSESGKIVDLSAVPGVVFTEPQVATVGLTRQQAEEQGLSVRVVCLPLAIVHRAIVNRERDGVFVLLADAQSERILGAQVAASNAGDVIYAATLAVKHGLTISDLVTSFAPYLTMAEGLRLSAVAFHRDVAKLSCCA